VKSALILKANLSPRRAAQGAPAVPGCSARGAAAEGRLQPRCGSVLVSGGDFGAKNGPWARGAGLAGAEGDAVRREAEPELGPRGQ